MHRAPTNKSFVAYQGVNQVVQTSLFHIFLPLHPILSSLHPTLSFPSRISSSFTSSSPHIYFPSRAITSPPLITLTTLLPLPSLPSLHSITSNYCPYFPYIPSLISPRFIYLTSHHFPSFSINFSTLPSPNFPYFVSTDFPSFPLASHTYPCYMSPHFPPLTSPHFTYFPTPHFPLHYFREIKFVIL